MPGEHSALPVLCGLFEVDRDEPRRVETAAGVAVLISVRSPAADGVNEDAAVALDGGAVTVLAVADGYGGGPTGERAARLSLEALAEGAASAADGAQALLAAARAANRAVSALGTGAATTLLAAVVDGATVTTMSVGDSMLVVVGQRGKIKLRSVPHSPVGYAVESGLLDEEDAMHHEARHFVSNMIGEPTLRMELTVGTPLSPRDTLVLGTDGLWDNLRVDEVIETVRTGALDEAAATLARKVRGRMVAPAPGEPSKTDDCTFILYRPV